MSTPIIPTAFPYACPQEFYAAETGMSLRDWFAGQAAPVLISLYGISIEPSGTGTFYDMVAQEAYRLADSMLVERERQP